MSSTNQGDLFNPPNSVPAMPSPRPAPNGMDAFRSAKERTYAQIRDLKAELEREAKTEKFWAEVVWFAESSWHFHLLDLLDKEKQRVVALKCDAPELAAQLEFQRDASQKLGEDALKYFVRHFPEACKVAGIDLDRDCRHPKYTFDERFLTLELNEKKHEAVLSTHEGRIGKKLADIPVLVDWLKQERKRLFERPFDGEKFLKTVRKAYKNILAKEKKTDGESLPIREVLKRMSGKADELNIDLAQLCRLSPQPSVDGRCIDFQQCKDTDRGMLLWKSTGGYVGFITFRETLKREDHA